MTATAIPADVRAARRNRMRAAAVSAAREQLDRDGEITVRGVTRALYMGAQAFYRYWPSIDQLQLAVAEDICTEVLAELSATVGAVEEADLPGRLAAAWTVLRQFQLRRRAHYTFVTGAAPGASDALFGAIGEHIAALVDATTAGGVR